MVETEPKQTTFAPYPAAAVANEVLRRAIQDKRLLKPLELLRFVYLVHGWYLATTGKPLIDEPVEARPYGPVFPSLVEDLKVYLRDENQPKPVTSPLLIEVEFEDAPTPQESVGLTVPFFQPEETVAKTVLDFVWRSYHEHSSDELAEVVTQDGTPWKEVFRRKPIPQNGTGEKLMDLNRRPIPNELIDKYYVKVWGKTHHA
jgi:uncharacterized phage-associated protein